MTVRSALSSEYISLATLLGRRPHARNEALPERARLVYVTPSHQFPTGVPMSIGRRAALLRWAVAHDAVVVEDDYDSEYRFSRQPVEPMQSLDRDGRVVYVGTFSKSLLPALRTVNVNPLEQPVVDVPRG